MAGSNKSGQDMEAGRTNQAEDHTVIWAQQEKGGHFRRDVILVVEPAGDIDDDDFEILKADNVHGIRSTANGTGAGIIGISSEHPFFARGADLSDDDLDHATRAGVFGKGLNGIVGQGNFNLTPGGIREGGGAGVIGRGGSGRDGKQVVEAPGVLGFAGGVKEFIKESHHGELNSGVLGLGANGVTGHGTSVGVLGVGHDAKPHAEPIQAGAPGVMGFGGRSSDESHHAPGVIGIGADDAFSVNLGEPGVLGKGQDGIMGVGRDGRGGIFASKNSAQVQLVPAQGHRIVENEAFIPTVVKTPLPALPKTGQGGDLMSLTDDLGWCTLWLCVKGSDKSGPAVWAQILLGPAFGREP